MKLQQLFSAFVGVALLGSIAAPSHAFMMDLDSSNVATLVEALDTEVKAGKTQCSVVLGKINEAIASIDGKLDAGVPNEKSFLSARGQLITLRSSLPCATEQLTQTVDGTKIQDGQVIQPGTTISDEAIDGTGQVVSDDQAAGIMFMDGQMVDGQMMGPGISGGTIDGGFVDGGFSGGSSFSGGGSFGGGGGGFGAAGAGGLGGLASLGSLGAVVATTASNNDSAGGFFNSPGNVISVSGGN